MWERAHSGFYFYSWHRKRRVYYSYNLPVAVWHIFSQSKQRTESSGQPVSRNTEYTVDITTLFSFRRASSLLIQVGRYSLLKMQLYELNTGLLRYLLAGRGRWWLAGGGAPILSFVLEQIWQRSLWAPDTGKVRYRCRRASPRFVSAKMSLTAAVLQLTPLREPLSQGTGAVSARAL